MNLPRLWENLSGSFQQYRLSVSVVKPLWCPPPHAFVGDTVITRLRVRPLQSNIDAVTKRSRATTVEQ